ncbi:hypothetical protein [Amycolatopsis sp. cmx-11-12]|uniref:hypothetical protein n=1 Tax=Amycolatopsis sp. cmx-11-12 TaxID=2785795 RepID=UPI0039184EC1
MTAERALAVGPVDRGGVAMDVETDRLGERLIDREVEVGRVQTTFSWPFSKIPRVGAERIDAVTGRETR